MTRSIAAPGGARRHLRPLLIVALIAGLTLVPSAASSDEGTAGDRRSADIAGGYFPDPNAWPWVTALVNPQEPASSGDFGRGFCTGTLISPTRVLTAAHCVVGDDRVTPRPASTMQALVGRRDLTQTQQGVRRNVRAVVVHPSYYGPDTGVHTYHAFYDIAVLFLSTPVTTIEPAVLGTAEDWNSWATVMGFGHFNYDHTNPQYDQYLRAADFDLLSDAQCSLAFDQGGTQHYFPSIHVCANNAPGAEYDCITHGDSGGPLMVQRADESWRLVGVTSFYPSGIGDRCVAGGPFGFAWVAGEAMRSWPLAVKPPAPDLHLSRTALAGYTKYMIRQNTNGRIMQLKRSCTRTSDSSFRCGLRWRIEQHSYSGRARYYHFARAGIVYWDYAFKGKRRPAGCGSCPGKRLRW